MQKSTHARTLKERSKKHIPFFIQAWIYRIVKKLRFLKSRYLEKIITKNEIKSILKKAGLKKNDFVVVHSSLGRIGHVDGGADTVIDAFLEIIGENGLLVMPGFCAPKFEKEKNMFVFDAQKTPTYTGLIPETFRKRRNVVRSISPTHSYCACGNKAKEFAKNHENCDNPFAMNGPFGKLYAWNAKIFLLGVDQLANTPLHIVEDKTDFPVRVFTQKFAVLVTNHGKKKIISARKHLDSLKKHRDPNILEPYCIKSEIMRVFKIGNTELRVLETKPFVDMMESLTEKGITIYHVK